VIRVTTSDGGIEPDSDVRIACYTALPWAVAVGAVAIVVGLFVCIQGGLL
jgi:hypothetical protein